NTLMSRVDLCSYAATRAVPPALASRRAAGPGGGSPGAITRLAKRTHGRRPNGATGSHAPTPNPPTAVGRPEGRGAVPTRRVLAQRASSRVWSSTSHRRQVNLDKPSE